MGLFAGFIDMTLCVAFDEDGYLHTTGDELGTSACQYVVQDSSALMLNPFNITFEEGGQIAVAILVVWAGAFVCRIIARMVLTSGDR